jgi:general secretion pathway protein D
MSNMKHTFTKTNGLLVLAAVLACGAGSARADGEGAATAENPDALMQRELIRRDELLLSTTKRLEEAEALIAAGKKAEARAIIDDVLAEIPNAGRGQQVYQKAAALMAEMNLRDAEAAMRQKKWYEARDLANQVLKVDPNNVRARAVIAKTDSILGIPAGKDKPESPAVDRKLVERLTTVEDNLKLAKDCMGTGQLDAAEAALLGVLKVDPYHKVASQMLKTVYEKKRRAAEIAHDSDRQTKLTQTREGWANNVRVENVTDASAAPSTPLVRSNQFVVNQKLKNIVIADVSFENATIQDAAQFLTAETRKQDPTGVNFLIGSPQVVEQAKPFSLKLRNVPVGEVLRYIASLAGVKYKVEEYAVFIVPLTDRTEVLVTREFPVQADFWDVTVDPADTGAGAAGGGTRRGAAVRTAVVPNAVDRYRSVLESRGVQFPAGASAIYNPNTGILQVTNTQDNIDLIEELVNSGSGEQLVVKIETRFVEINQSDLDALAFNYQLAGNAAFLAGGGFAGDLSGSKFNFGAASGSTNLQGANGIREIDGINSYINDANPRFPDAAVGANNQITDPRAQNAIGINALLSGNQLSALLLSLDQATGTDIMTAPSIVVNDGEQGKITVAREFQFPIEFDQPQVTTVTVTFGAGDDEITNPAAPIIIPAWPTDFEKRNVGVTMTVVPKVTVDRQRVFLTINPVVTEFDGFINYGSAMFTTRDDNGAPINSTRVVDNQILQPVFSTRELQNAKVEVQDGYTLVLGGLLREDISTVEDKVPFLGDLPGIGRFFRSKAEQSVKKNLLIFVSVRVLRPNGQPFNIATGPESLPQPGS